MMHHYLNQLNIRKNDTIENEKLTDIACAYLGVGHLLLEAYSPIEWTSDHWERNNQSGHTIHRTWIGYVTTETLRDTLSLSTELRELSPNQVVKSIVSSSDRSIMRVKLFKYRFLLFRKLVRESINKNTKVILQSKHSKVDLMCNELLKINYDLVKSLDLLTKNNLEKLSFKNGPNIVNIVNSLAVGKFENEIFNLKLNLSKNIIFVPRTTLKKLNEIEEQLNEAVQLFRRLRNN